MEDRKTVFISGSRSIKRISTLVATKLDMIIKNNVNVVIGDANGFDKAAQTYFHNQRYRNVTVYYMGDEPRNNIGSWATKTVVCHQKTKNFKYYAQKDIAMAQTSDYGLVVWNGESPGSIINAIRMSMLSKNIVIIAPGNTEIRDVTSSTLSNLVNEDVIARLSPQEKSWLYGSQQSLL